MRGSIVTLALGWGLVAFGASPDPALEVVPSYDAAGLRALQVNGVELLEDGAVRVTSVRLADAYRNPYELADPYVKDDRAFADGSVEVREAGFDPAEKRLTQRFDWGAVAVAYRSGDGGFDIEVAIQNRSPQVIERIGLEVIALKLPEGAGVDKGGHNLGAPVLAAIAPPVRHYRRVSFPAPVDQGLAELLGPAAAETEPAASVDVRTLCPDCYPKTTAAHLMETRKAAVALGTVTEGRCVACGAETRLPAVPRVVAGTTQADRPLALEWQPAGPGVFRLEMAIGSAPAAEVYDGVWNVRPIRPGAFETIRIDLRFGPADQPASRVAWEFVKAFGEAHPFLLNWPDRRPIGMVHLTAETDWGKGGNPRGWWGLRPPDTGAAGSSDGTPTLQRVAFPPAKGDSEGELPGGFGDLLPTKPAEIRTLCSGCYERMAAEHLRETKRQAESRGQVKEGACERCGRGASAVGDPSLQAPRPIAHIDTPEGRAIFDKWIMDYADQLIAVADKAGSQGVIVWDLEGKQYPGVVYYGDPRIMQYTAPEMEAMADAFFKRLTDAGLRVGMCIRPHQIYPKAVPDDEVEKHRTNGFAELPYHETWERFNIRSFGLEFWGYGELGLRERTPLRDVKRCPVARLDAIINYCRARWGATLFYIDTNHFKRSREKRAPNAAGGHDILHNWGGAMMSAQQWEELCRRHPECLLIPEHEYTQYWASTAPYRQPPYDGPTPERVRAIYPESFSCISMGGNAQPHIERSADAYAREVERGDLLMPLAWFGPPAVLIESYAKATQSAPVRVGLNADGSLTLQGNVVTDLETLRRQVAVQVKDRPFAERRTVVRYDPGVDRQSRAGLLAALQQAGAIIAWAQPVVE